MSVQRPLSSSLSSFSDPLLDDVLPQDAKTHEYDLEVEEEDMYQISRLDTVELSQSFLCMEARKITRASVGSYKDNPRGPLWGFLYGSLMAIYVLFKLYDLWQTGVFDITWEQAQGVTLIVLLGVTFAAISSSIQVLAVALTLFWIFLLLVIFTLTSEEFRYIVVEFILLTVITWIGHFSYYRFFPFFVRRSGMCFAWRRIKKKHLENARSSMNTSISSSSSSSPLAAKHLPSIEEHVFQYVPIVKFLFMCFSKRIFLYRGEIKEGKPHGWGEWRDDSAYGESLVGYWEKGIPVGPFVSCERKTGNCFSSVIVGFCSMRTKDWRCVPALESSKKLSFGFASIECAISGSYYKNYPLTHYKREKRNACVCTSPSDTCLGVSSLVPHLLHIQNEEVVTSVSITSTPDNSLEIGGFNPLDEAEMSSATVSLDLNLRDGRGVPGIRIENWTQEHSNEALVFLHGYNIPLEWALNKIAQMVAGGQFPANIKPFVFSWPTGKLFFYFQAVKICEEDPQTIESFGHFIKSLIDANFQRVHIITHSMGVRLFFAAMKSPAFRELFRPKAGGEGAREEGQITLQSVILCNPDYPIKTFRDEICGLIQQFCSNTTIYADRNDGALNSAAFFTRIKRLGSLDGPLLTQMRRGKALDVDVVDASGLQDNMHNVRHSAFNLNRVMVEDIRDIVVGRTRAHSRSSRLVNKQANFFSFMTTPSIVNGNIV